MWAIFSKPKCHICNTMLDKNYAEIHYKYGLEGNIEKVKICSKCADEMNNLRKIENDPVRLRKITGQ